MRSHGRHAGIDRNGDQKAIFAGIVLGVAFAMMARAAPTPYVIAEMQKRLTDAR